jgi:hypothetical protein
MSNGDMSAGTAVQGQRTPGWLTRQDVAVALLVSVALALGALLGLRVDGATATFQEDGSPFRIAYPATWSVPEPPAGMLLRAEDPRTDSAYKTTLTVERRDIDPAAPPTLQTLVDRRIAQRSELTAHTLLVNDEATVDGERGARLEYAYVAQPIEGPRRSAVPVVVRAREYVVVAADRAYYITLAAPEAEADGAFARFERMIGEARVR